MTDAVPAGYVRCASKGRTRSPAAPTSCSTSPTPWATTWTSRSFQTARSATGRRGTAASARRLGRKRVQRDRAAASRALQPGRQLATTRTRSSVVIARQLRRRCAGRVVHGQAALTSAFTQVDSTPLPPLMLRQLVSAVARARVALLDAVDHRHALGREVRRVVLAHAAGRRARRTRSPSGECCRRSWRRRRRRPSHAACRAVRPPPPVCRDRTRRCRRVRATPVSRRCPRARGARRAAGRHDATVSRARRRSRRAHPGR